MTVSVKARVARALKYVLMNKNEQQTSYILERERISLNFDLINFLKNKIEEDHEAYHINIYIYQSDTNKVLATLVQQNM